jgi:hypothetical protein
MNGIKIPINCQMTRRAARCISLLTVTAGLTVAATGCATAASHSAGAVHPVRAAHPARAAARPHTATTVPVASARLAQPSTAPVPTGGPVSSAYRGPHFNTPQAAMRFLAAAYNNHNSTELHWVTTPVSYARLMGMRSEAINLRLRSCTLNRGRGDYTCHFSHDYLPSLHKTGHGAATFIAAPALTPGWYMYTFLDCG